MSTKILERVGKADQPFGPSAAPAPGTTFVSDRGVAQIGPGPRLKRKGKSLRPWLGFIAWVLVPFALACIYYGVVATDRYVSETKFLVQRSGSPAPSLQLAFLPGLPSTAREDSFIVRDYILSADLLRLLDERFHLKQVYQNNSIDLLTRLSSNASFEDFLKYWRSMVAVEYDTESGILTIALQGFDRSATRDVLNALMTESEHLVNNLSRSQAMEEVNFARNEVALAENRMQDIKRRMLGYQNDSSLIDPTSNTASILGIISELEGETAKAQAELSAMRRVMAFDAPQVVTLANRIAALKRQIDQERGRLAGTGAAARLNSEVARFEELKLELEFATHAYKSAVTSLETARIEATKKLKSLSIIAAPGLADDASYPDRVRCLATVLAALLIAFGIMRLGVAFVRDHQD